MVPVHTLGKIAFVDECWDDMGTLKVAGYSVSLQLFDEYQSIHKLSWGPKTFVGMAEVKLHPNSSLYALGGCY